MAGRKSTVGLIVALLVIALGLGLIIYSVVESNDLKWVRSVESSISVAKTADDAWEVRYALEEANAILAEHDWDQTLDYYIDWTFEAEEIEDERMYRRELFQLKKGLNKTELNLPNSYAPFGGVLGGGLLIIIGVIVVAAFASREGDC